MAKELKTVKGAFEGFDFEEFKKEALKRLQCGDKLSGEGGIFSGLLQRFINAALEGELTAHLKEEKEACKSNRRNGYTRKQVRSEHGSIEISPPRDREGSFEPVLVKKWDRSIGTGLNDQILLMYAHGNSYSDIQYQLKKIYGVEISNSVISEVTSSVATELSDWQERQLQSMYVVLFLDGIYFTSRENDKSQKKVVYSVYGVDADGNRDILGLYAKGSEATHEWTKIMADIKKRGVEDVLFICIDGLKGLSDSIAEEFPNAVVQRCIVHKVRNSVKYVDDKDRKAVCKDLKSIYNVSDVNQAEIGLDSFKKKWDTQYPEIAKLWERDWGEVTNFLAYGEGIKKLIYTTNPVEALHRQIRKVTKTKGIWVNDKALITQLYITLNYTKGSWKKKVFNWIKISRELKNEFGERYTMHCT
jgi:transposase-like protein